MSGEFVVGRAQEAQLSKTLLPKVNAQDLQAIADNLRSTSNCVIKVVSHRR
jgi:GH24 family phage-related lysozyme (muramidase)